MRKEESRTLKKRQDKLQSEDKQAKVRPLHAVQPVLAHFEPASGLIQKIRREAPEGSDL